MKLLLLRIVKILLQAITLGIPKLIDKIDAEIDITKIEKRQK